VIGRKLSHFQVEKELGAGSIGVVYLAVDERLGRKVAIKVLNKGLLSDENARRRLRREARALSRLSHPNVEVLLDVGNEEGLDFLVMELLEGQTLADRLEGGPLPEPEVLELGLQLVSAVEAAHRNGIAHRDLKPANIAMLEDGRLKVIDFGLAKALSTEVGGLTESVSTETNVGLGTVPYMAPEQLRGEFDERCDLYGAGAVLYEMLAGARAFPQEDGSDLIYSLMHVDPAPPSRFQPEVSPAMDAVVLKALAKRPEDRYPNAGAMLAALRGVGPKPEEGSRLEGLLRRIGLR
jgi:serine/threonine protein kinase